MLKPRHIHFTGKPEPAKSTISFLHPHEEALEEWAELTAYWALVSIVLFAFCQNKLLTQKH
jgi:hypothetical protein